jgi:predicted RNA-binding Zn ribbon-like protein
MGNLPAPISWVTCFPYLPDSPGTLVTAKRAPPFFIADHPGLDFLNSIAVPVDTKVEWLGSGEDFLAWIKQAGLVHDDVLNSFRKSTLPGELDAIAAQARGLRDWFKPFVYKHMGRPIEPKALRQLEPLNQLLARDDEFGQIVVRHRLHKWEHDHGEEETGVSGLAWRPQRRWQSPESLLLPLARSLADLVCTEDFTYVKACEGPDCTLLFVDRTRGRARRWCSMAMCGNRAKQAAHRKRAQNAKKRPR